MAPVKQNYNHIHLLPPGLGRAVKYSCFLPCTQEGPLWVLPILPHRLEAGSLWLVGQKLEGSGCPGGSVPRAVLGTQQRMCPAELPAFLRALECSPGPCAFLLLPLHESLQGNAEQSAAAGDALGWPAASLRGLLSGAFRDCVPYSPIQTQILCAYRCRDYATSFLSPSPGFGARLNSAIKLKVVRPDKSIKILFATTPTDKSHPIRGLASCPNIWLILSRTHNNTSA